MGGRVKTTKAKPWHYTDCGLGNIWLVGIEVETDPKTGEQEPLIPRLRDLHDCIFLTLVQKSAPLDGREVRYLQRHLGWTQAAAAEKLGFNSPQYFADLERRDVAFRDTPVDLVWRLLCVNALEEKTTSGRRKQAKSVRNSILRETENLLARLRDRARAPAVQIIHTPSEHTQFWKPILKVA